jgi:cell division protein FtsL
MNKWKQRREYRKSGSSLSLPRMIFFLFCFTVLTFFLLAHVFLRFTIRDLRIESARLQRQYDKMMAVEKSLVWEIGSMSQGDRLHEMATQELGLKDADPASIERLAVSTSLIADYSTGGRNSGYEQARWMEEKYGKGFGKEVGSFLEINKELNAREQALDEVWKRIREKEEKKDSDK